MANLQARKGFYAMLLLKFNMRMSMGYCNGDVLRSYLLTPFHFLPYVDVVIMFSARFANLLIIGSLTYLLGPIEIIISIL
jgi:hypothetical protein